MLKVPRMLLIGSSGRNSGKTEFACTLLRRLAGGQPVTGVKVTVIRRNDGTCPRGGEGCGVCSSLEGTYCITEETDRDGRKDTARLLAAGADRVFWLRVMAAHMEDGLSALLELTGPEATLICESNSLRNAVEPGLFLMVRDTTSDTFKATARAVAGYADRTVCSDGRQFDIDLADIGLRRGRWTLREPVTAIVLAGGNSTRMGTDKSLISIEGRPMIQYVCDQLKGHFEEILVSANDRTKYGFLNLKVVPDRETGMGPMMGLASALQAASHELALAVACDLPRLDLPLARRMLARAPGHDAVVPRLSPASNGRPPLLEPLFAVYRRPVADTMLDLLQSGERRLRRVFPRVRTHFFDVDEATSLLNLNTEEDYRAYVGRTHAAL